MLRCISRFMIVFVAVFSMFLILSVDMFYRPAFAWSVVTYAVGEDASSVVRNGNYVYVANEGNNSVTIFAVSAPSVVYQTVSSITSPTAVFAYDGKVYAVGSSTLYEIDRTSGGLFFVSRSVATTSVCANLRHVDARVVNPDTGEFICVRTSADIFRIIDLDSMTITFTSDALTADCDAPDSATWSPNNDRVIMVCDTSNTLVAYPPNSSTFSHKESIALLDGCVASMPVDLAGRVMLCDHQLYSYSQLTGFVVVDADVFSGLSIANISTLQYDQEGRRWVFTDANEVAHFVEDSTGDYLSGVALGVAGVTGFHVYGSELSYFSTGTSDDKYGVFELSDIPTGEGSSEDEDPTCGEGEVAVILSDGTFICVEQNDDGSVDLGGQNPFFGPNSNSTVGLVGMPYTLSLLMNISLDTAKVIAMIFLVILSFLLVIIPSWKFGHNPPFVFYFIILVLDITLGVALGWVDVLYFYAMIVLAAVAGAAKMGGYL